MRHRALWIVVAGFTVSLAFAAVKKEAQPQPVGGENEGAEELNMLRGRAQWWFERHLGSDGFVPWNARANALTQLYSNIRSGRLSMKRAAVTAPSPAIEGDVWLPIGPRPIFDGGYAYAGRVTALATVPGSPNTVYLGAAQGGVWKTVDGGNTWVPLTDDQDTLAIGSLTVDPSNSSVIYAGTGEVNQSCDSHYGVGLLRSADAGATWTTLGASTFQNTSIARVIVHPTIPTTLWVANGSGSGGFSCYGRSGTFGVYKSVDGGASWTLVLGQTQTGVNLTVHDLIISPSDPDTLYAGVRTSGIWKTTNGGSTWAKLSHAVLPSTDLGRIDLAVHPTNGTLFALIERQSNGRPRGTFRSTNAGANWTSLSNPEPTTCQYWSFSDLCTYSGNNSGQCWYDLVIEVQPDATVWQGGSAIVKSINNGTSWIDVCPQSVHVDQHAIAFDSIGRVWIGNDGGVWASSNGGDTWLNKNGDLQITQFYPGAALDPSNYDIAMGGTQDNGTPRSEGFAAWGLTTFGDGAACVIDSSDPLTFYTSSQYLNINKTTDGGFSFNDATNGLFDSNTTAAPFIGQFTACPANPATLIAGSDNVWLTTNRADNWVSNSPDPIESSGSRIVTLAFAATDTTCGTYAVGTRSGRIYRTTDSGLSWLEITGGLPFRAVNDLAFDPTDANVLYAAVSGFGGPHLYRTADALSLAPTWFTADAGIPDAPINAVLVDPFDPTVVYAGSDLGLFKSVDAGVSWALQLNGIPRIAIHDLVADATTRAFVAFTHGRGAFRLNLVCTPPQFSGVESASDSSACDAGTSVSWSSTASWGQLASTGTYELQRFDGADCAGVATTVATGIFPQTLAVTDASTTPGNTYSYRVIATNDCAAPISDAGANTCSQAVVDEADLVPCSDVGPTLLLSHDPTDATLTWDAVACSDIQSYGVYAAPAFDAPFPSGWTLLGSPGATTFTDPLASAFVAYRVITFDACNNPSE